MNKMLLTTLFAAAHVAPVACAAAEYALPQLPDGVPALVQDVQRQLHPVRPQHQDRL